MQDKDIDKIDYTDEELYEFWGSSGMKFEGEFDQNGKRQGPGKLYWKNKSLKFEGFYKDDLPNGPGKAYYPNGAIGFDGDWKNGLRDGNGKFYDEFGKLKFSGFYVRNFRNGDGKFYHNNGNLEYKGYWENGIVIDTEGSFYHKNGNQRYRGELKDGTFHGFGSLYHKNGYLIYNGAQKNGYPYGFGTEYIGVENFYNEIDSDEEYTSVIRYQGEFFQGCRKGYGKEYYLNGQIKQIGKWSSDHEIDQKFLMEFDYHGSIINYRKL